jgi:hypothetical protein
MNDLRWHDNSISYRVNQLFINLENMKKLAVVFLFMAMGSLAMAKAGPGVSSTKEKEMTMKHLRDDVRANEATRKVVGHDWSRFRIRQAFRDHKQVKETNKRVTADSRWARAEGIEHPVSKAKRQVRVQDDNAKDHI